MGVTLLAVPAVLLDSPIGIAMGASILGLFGLAVGFLALAVARRLGFLVLWLLLCALWTNACIPFFPLGVFQFFLAWSILALPLATLSAIGFPLDGASAAGWRRIHVALLAVWPVAIGLCFWLRSEVWDLGRVPSEQFARALGWLVLLPLPFVLAIYYSARVLRDVRQDSRPDGEASQQQPE